MLPYQHLKHSTRGLASVPAISSQSCASAQTQPYLGHTGVKHFQHLVMLSLKYNYGVFKDFC
jgi:hypothetical protein